MPFPRGEAVKQKRVTYITCARPARLAVRITNLSFAMAFFDSLLKKNPLLESCVIAGGSHVGLVRATNEDCFLYVNSPESNAILAGVADGMGGHEFGEVASYLVMKYLLREWKRRDRLPFETKEQITEFIRDTLNTANEHIYHVNKELKIRWCMGTTLSLGVFVENRVIFAQIGDSRCYRLRKNKLKQMTVDQSWREEMVMNGIMTVDEASNHPLSNMLTNCVGAMKNLRIEFTYDTIHPGDRYLFCSDGLSSMVSDERISRLLQETRRPAEGVDELIKYALRGGGTDNITVVSLYT